MALKLNEAYPGRFNNPSPEYPQGSFKNRTTPTAEDGSYFEQQWANDHLAFLSSLLDGAGVEANGSVDQVGSSQYYNALLQIITDNTPELPTGTPGVFSNLKSSASGISSIVNVTASAISVLDAENKAEVLNGVSVSPSLAVSGVNGLDSGVSAASTWYYIYVIWNGTTTSGLFSLSATSPTLPSGYTHKARVGAIRTDASVNKYPLGFNQFGSDVEYRVATGSNVTQYRTMASGALGTTNSLAAVAVGAFIPPTATKIKLSLLGGSGSNSTAAPSASFTGGLTGPMAPPLNNSGSTSTTFNLIGEFIIESTNIFYFGGGASSAIQCVGYKDGL